MSRRAKSRNAHLFVSSNSSHRSENDLDASDDEQAGSAQTKSRNRSGSDNSSSTSSNSAKGSSSGSSRSSSRRSSSDGSDIDHHSRPSLTLPRRSVRSHSVPHHFHSAQARNNARGHSSGRDRASSGNASDYVTLAQVEHVVVSLLQQLDERLDALNVHIDTRLNAIEQHVHQLERHIARTQFVSRDDLRALLSKPAVFVDAPADAVVACAQDVPPLDAVRVRVEHPWQAADQLDVRADERVATGACATVIERRWRATDALDRTVEHCQRVEIVPPAEQAPRVHAPDGFRARIELPNDALPPPAEPADRFAAHDWTGAPLPVVFSERRDGQRTIVREYAAVDRCLRRTVVTQTVEWDAHQSSAARQSTDAQHSVLQPSNCTSNVAAELQLGVPKIKREFCQYAFDGLKR